MIAQEHMEVQKEAVQANKYGQEARVKSPDL